MEGCTRPLVSTTLLVIWLALSVHSQEITGIPRAFALQVYLESSGRPSSGTYVVEVSWYTTAVGGTAQHTELLTADVTNGIATMIVGSVTPLPDSLLRGQTWWLGIRVDDGEQLVTRTPVLSVPYALMSQRAMIADSVVRSSPDLPPPAEQGMIRPARGQSVFMIQPRQQITEQVWVSARVAAVSAISAWVWHIDVPANTIEVHTSAPLTEQEALLWIVVPYSD